MKISECLQELDQKFQFDVETLTKIGVHLVQKIKRCYEDFEDEFLAFENKTYPRSGWFLSYESGNIFMANGDVKVLVELNPIPINSFIKKKEIKNNVINHPFLSK